MNKENFEKYQNLADFLLDSQAEKSELEAISQSEQLASQDLQKELDKWNY